MIESEIAILSSVDHANIIKLQEVFDFPEEKYLIMEFVSVSNKGRQGKNCHLFRLWRGRGDLKNERKI